MLFRSSLQGKLTVKFSIEPGGSVSSISATGLGDAAVETCVANVIRSIQFPASDGLTEVSYPFIFVTP